MNCKTVSNTLISYSNGELSNSENEIIETHLKNCGSCYNVWCVFNVTSEEHLPSEDNPDGVGIRDDSCKDFHRDWQIPSTLTLGR